MNVAIHTPTTIHGLGVEVSKSNSILKNRFNQNEPATLTKIKIASRFCFQLCRLDEEVTAQLKIVNINVAVGRRYMTDGFPKRGCNQNTRIALSTSSTHSLPLRINPAIIASPSKISIFQLTLESLVNPGWGGLGREYDYSNQDQCKNQCQ